MSTDYILEFKDVSFGYSEDKMVLQHVQLQLEQGKTYALVGPTGNGKSTTASLMMRLFDPQSGVIYFMGKDLRSYSPAELSQEIGFILQEPFLFTGTLSENLRYGNADLHELTNEQLLAMMKEEKLEHLLDTFSDGLETEVHNNSQNISLGQKQLIAFLRVMLRKPKLIIMDEATANIDTVTENNMQRVLNDLPKSTTKVVIAHRLNTIQNADQIFFINGGKINPAVDFDDALNLINEAKLKN